MKPKRRLLDLKKNGYTAAISGIFLFVVFYLFSEEFLQGFKAGLLNCAEIVIPSLFPFLAAASLAGAGEMPKCLKKIISPVTELVFRLPADSLVAIVLGQLGGYLSGAKAADSLLRRGAVSEAQAERILLFCVNPGLGFTVNAIGFGLLGSREAGKILLLSMCVSSLILGAFAGFFSESEQVKRNIEPKPEPFSAAVVNSVASSAAAMLSVCAFVAVFSGINAIFAKTIKNQTVLIALSCLSEVTSGCAAAARQVSLPVTAAVCAFGGICVHLQIFSLSGKLKINYAKFYLFRILHAALSFLICSAALYIHPLSLQTSLSVAENAAPWSFSAPAAISLLFLCALLILDLDNARKIC